MNLCIMPRWWLHRSFIFTLTWGNDPIWLINMFQIGRKGHLDEFFLAKQPWYSPRSWYHDSWLMSGFSCCITLDKGTVPYPHTQPCPVKICRSSFPGVFFLLGPILPKARNSTHEKMKLPKGKLYSNHRFLGEQREKITWLFTYAGKYNYLSYVGIIIHHYKDPY